MARQPHCSIRQNLHSLIAAQRLEVAQVELEAAVLWRNNFADLIAIRIFAVRGKTHDFAFVAVLAIADKFANHRVDTAERVRKKHALEHFDVIALATCHHARYKIT